MSQYSLDSVLARLQVAKKAGKKIVTTNGCFDLLHRGHVEYLERAKALGDVLVVGVNSDASVKKLKGAGRPINRAEDRAYVLSKLKSVDEVLIFDEDLPNAFLEKIRPDVHVKGGDYVAEKLPEFAPLKSVGAKVVIIPLVQGYSTTQTIERSTTIK